MLHAPTNCVFVLITNQLFIVHNGGNVFFWVFSKSIILIHFCALLRFQLPMQVHKSCYYVIMLLDTVLQTLMVMEYGRQHDQPELVQRYLVKSLPSWKIVSTLLLRQIFYFRIFRLKTLACSADTLFKQLYIAHDIYYLL